MKTQYSKQNDKISRSIRRVLQIVLILLIVLSTGAWMAGAPAKKHLLEQYPASGQLVDVDGHKMHIHCTGEGSPTVILVAGLDDLSITWSLVQPEIAKITRVCSYDRAGLGWSEASPDPRTSEIMVRELHTLLINAKVEGPYVMVGHSFGGALTQLYIHNYPNEVVGLVLVDAAPTELFDRIPAWSKAIKGKLGMYRVLAALNSMGLLALSPSSIPNRGFPEEVLSQYRTISAATDYYRTCIAENEMFAKNLAGVKSTHITGFGNLPLVVLSRGTWDTMPGLSETENGQAKQAWQEMQSELLKLSSNSRQVVAEKSEHFIQLQQPQVVIDSIRMILQKEKP